MRGDGWREREGEGLFCLFPPVFDVAFFSPLFEKKKK